MYKYLLESAGDIDWMALLPLLIFIGFFTAVLIVTMLRSKKYIQHMAQLPINEDPATQNIEL